MVNSGTSYENILAEGGRGLQIADVMSRAEVGENKDKA
jgi:hypothetical protein